MGEAYLVTISTYYNSCLDWYSMYAIRYKELVKKDEGINNNMEKKRDKKISCEGNGCEELSYISGMIQRRVHMWILYAIGSAFFAGITAILAKCGFI